MRIVTTKQPHYLKQLEYAVLGAGTTGDVWHEEAQENKQASHESLGKQSTAYDA